MTFLDMTEKTQSIKDKIGKLDSIKIKASDLWKNAKRMEKETIQWGKLFIKQTSDKVLITKIYKQFSKQY